MADLSARWQRKLAGGRWGAVKRLWWVLRFKRIDPHEALGIDITAEHDEFVAYLGDAGIGPGADASVVPVTVSTAEAQTSGQQWGSPGPLLLLVALMAELRMSFAEAVNIPIALARWLVAAHAERVGRVNVLDRDLLRDLNEGAARLAAKEGVPNG